MPIGATLKALDMDWRAAKPGSGRSGPRRGAEVPARLARGQARHLGNTGYGGLRSGGRHLPGHRGTGGIVSATMAARLQGNCRAGALSSRRQGRPEPRPCILDQPRRPWRALAAGDSDPRNPQIQIPLEGSAHPQQILAPLATHISVKTANQPGEHDGLNITSTTAPSRSGGRRWAAHGSAPAPPWLLAFRAA